MIIRQNWKKDKSNRMFFKLLICFDIYAEVAKWPNAAVCISLC